MIEIIINNKKYTVDKNLSILQACEFANILVPRFCFHEKLSIAGNCRMCLVEVEKSPKPVAACAMPVNSGMVIFTETPLVKKARESVLEFLLINHPLDCPICDQAGECDLQDLTLNYGSDRSRFFEFKHGVEDKDCGPIVKTIMTRCIHCTRCIRFLTELVGTEVFGALGRGEAMEIGPFFNKYLKTELSGNLVDLCPVGALTSKPYAFIARNWELKKIEAVDCFDSFGSNIIIHTRNNTTFSKIKKNTLFFSDQILRILPKLNNNLNENWISDKTRYSFDGLYFNRCFQLKQNLKKIKAGISIQKNINISWNIEFLLQFFSSLQINNNFKKEQKQYLIGTIGSLTNVEELYFFFKFLKFQGNRNLLQNNALYNFNIEIPLFYQFNSLFREIDNTDFILLINANPRLESAMLNMRIRKQFFNKEILIATIGAFQELNYSTVHLGNTFKSLIHICEGKHFINKIIRGCKKPLVILGSDNGLRVDNKIIQTLSFFLIKKSFLFLKNFNGYNILHSNLLQIQTCELGIKLNSTNILYQQFLNKNLLQTLNYKIICNNIDTYKNISISNIVGSLQSFITPDQIDSESFTVPVNTLFEKNNLFINNEGKIQKSFKIISPLSNARSSEHFFQTLIILNIKNLNKKYLTNKWFFFENPFLKQTKLSRKPFYLNIFKTQQCWIQKIYFNFENQHFNLKDFYLNNIISKNSKTMAECALFLHKNSNFF